MRTLLELRSRSGKSGNLLLLIAALLILLLLAIAGVPPPDIDAKFNVATVHIKADRAWVFLPRQCAAIVWDAEGIQSFSVNEQIMAGRGEMEFCPTFNHTSLIFKVITVNGDLHTIDLNVQDLPAAVMTCLLLMLLLLPFLIASYYLATLRVKKSFPFNLSSVLALVAIFLMLLLMHAVRPFSIGSVVNGLRDLFTSPIWQELGLVLASLVYVPLLVQLWRQGSQWVSRADYVVVGAIIVFILLLYTPFGFDSIGQQEEWIVQAFLEGRSSKIGSEMASRFSFPILYRIANITESHSFSGYTLIQFVWSGAKLLFIYAIARRLKIARLYAFLFAMLVMVYPVNSHLLSTRSAHLAVTETLLLAAVYLMLLFIEKPSRLKLLGVYLALFFSIGLYESAYLIIALVPILWWWHSPRWTWRNFNLTALWYAIPAAKPIYLYLLSNAGWKYYGAYYLSTALRQERTILESVSHQLSVVGNVYLQSFVYGWQEALVALGDNLWIVPTLASILLVAAVAAYLTRPVELCVEPSTRQIGTWLLGGLFFILPSIGVLMWFEKYQLELWRIYIYVPLGAAAVVKSLLLLILSPVKNFRLRRAIIVCLCPLLMFPAVSRLFVQHGHFVNSANAKAMILLQIVEQAPYFDAGARLMLVTDMSLDDLHDAGIAEMYTNMFDSAIFMFYQEGRPKVAFLCLLSQRCSTDDIGIKDNYLENGTDYSDFVMLRLYDDLSVELLYDLPPELNDSQNHTYDPEPLIDTSAPIPPRALIMLASARRLATDS